MPATVAKFGLALFGKQIPEDVWQLRAPVDELVPVSQGGGKRDKLNLVTTEALGLGGHEVQLWEEKNESDVLRSEFCFLFQVFYLFAEMERDDVVVLGVQDQQGARDVVHTGDDKQRHSSVR